MTLFYITLACISGGILSVLAAALITYKVLGPLVQRLVSFAAGALLGAAFLELLPHAFESGVNAHTLFGTDRKSVV